MTKKITKLIAPGLCLIAVIFSINALGQKSKYTSEESSELTLVSTMDAKEVSEELKFTPADVNFNYFEKIEFFHHKLTKKSNFIDCFI